MYITVHNCTVVNYKIWMIELWKYKYDFQQYFISEIQDDIFVESQEFKFRALFLSHLDKN